jgi:uncharacterized protein
MKINCVTGLRSILVVAGCLSIPGRAEMLDASLVKPRVEPVAPARAKPFRLQEVRLLPGPFKEGQDIAVKYLLSLEPDRFLANFRKEAGLEPRAEHYPGWERQGVSGHSGGHYLSACSLAWAATGDERFRERVNYLVTELAACQAAPGDGYVAAIPNGRQVYAEVAAGNIRSAGFDLNGCWVPNYTMHKLFAGLRDAYRLAGNAQALDVARKLADWFEKTHAGLSEEQMQQVLACEHGGINETFADLYADTGDPRYLELSRRFQHRAILDPLSRGEDILPGKHANTQIPKLMGLATRYELAGDETDRRTAEFFWERVVNHHSYVTGGHCDHEHFGPPDRLNDRLSPATTETCNVYNMLKLTRHIFGWRPEASVADFYERALLNHIRSTQHPDGRVIYNLSLQPGHHKEYQALYDGWTCCMGTGMENHVRYGDAIYFHDDAGLWVNLYLASELDWKERGVKIRQSSEWPDRGSVTFTFETETPQDFVLRLRQPYWADRMEIQVNGESQLVDAEGKVTAQSRTKTRMGHEGSGVSSYHELRRPWQTGDRVTVTLGMALRTESMPDNPNRKAIFYGPSLLAADLGALDDPEAGTPFYVPAMVTEGKPVTDWVASVSLETLTFKTDGVGRPRDVDLVPFHRLHDRRYTVYLDEFDASQWAARQAEHRAEQERLQALEARTVDVLRIGEMQPERDHGLEGERTGAGDAFGRKWRHAFDGGWFGFELKVLADVPQELLVTYWGGDGGNRVFDVLVEGEKLATQRLERNQPDKFFDVAYAVPAELARGKEKVKVRFQAHPGATAGGVFGVRMVKTEAGAASVNLIPNASFEEVANNRPRRWRPERWTGEGSTALADSGRTGGRSVFVTSERGADLGWAATVPLEPFGRYRLSGWIKTDQVAAGSGRGALLNVHDVQPAATPAVTGTQDWTRVETVFEVQDQHSVQINCLLGGWGSSTGRAWFDDVRLERIASLPVPAPRLTIDAAEVREPMSANIYSQFIEHLGRCIYGGIWAEMLEDRKFYYPITEKYDPYRALRDTEYPVVGASPWEIIGEADSVSMSTVEPFVGRHTPELKVGSTIRQHDLGITAGQSYVGYAWLKRAGDGRGSVEVVLRWGEGDAAQQTVRFERVGKEYRKFPFKFEAGATTDKASLDLKVSAGPVLVGTLSLMPANHVEGLRADTLALLRELKAPIYRWPGGNFVSGYDWRDGVGDRDRRPPRTNPAWTGVEHNDFGMHEFIRFCKLVGTEPWITVNTGFGDAHSAAAQLEYCNGAASTPYGRLRAANGAREPFGVRYWGIGNEMWGSWQLGFMALEHYVIKQNWVVDKMREVDPDIIPISSGNAGPWSTGLLKACADHMDYIAEHFYCQERPGLMAHVRQIPDNIRAKAEFHRKARQEIPGLEAKDIRISMTEWNYWYGPHPFGELGTRYFLKDALGIAAGLHEYARQSDIVESAFYAQTVNVIGCIKTSRRNAAFETTGLVLKLYRQHFGELPVATSTEGLIDAQAAWSRDRKTLTIGIVNATLQSVEVPIELRGARLKGNGTRWQIAGSDPMAFNDPEQPPQVRIEENAIVGLRDRLVLAPCSVTVFALDAE